jgi:DNA-binding Lrp family transcriptional regulator
MDKTLDSLDIRILEALNKHGPRSVLYIAKMLGQKWDIVNYRLERLSTYFSLFQVANVQTSHIGLRSALILANSVPGFEETLSECMTTHDFWHYTGRCYGKDEGCYAIYEIPPSHIKEFKRFAHLLADSGLARNTRILWTTDQYAINPGSEWFDPRSGSWSLYLNKWIEEVPQENPRLPIELKEPRDFPVKVDEIDIRILHDLEIDAKRSLKEIAQKMGTTPQIVSYHYRNHVIGRKLIGKWRVWIRPFSEVCDRFVFFFRFSSEEKMARFASSLMNKPFVLALCRIINENDLIVHLYLPMIEFRRLIDSLSKLIRGDLLQAYDYIIEDTTKARAQTIPEENFKNGTWVYRHKMYMRNLTGIIDEAHKIIGEIIAEN